MPVARSFQSYVDTNARSSVIFQRVSTHATPSPNTGDDAVSRARVWFNVSDATCRIYLPAGGVDGSGRLQVRTKMIGVERAARHRRGTWFAEPSSAGDDEQLRRGTVDPRSGRMMLVGDARIVRWLVDDRYLARAKVVRNRFEEVILDRCNILKRSGSRVCNIGSYPMPVGLSR